MALEQGLHTNSQAWVVPAVEQGLRSGLQGYLDIFLLSCKVENCSEQTLIGYRGKLGLFVHFSDQSGVKELNQVTANHIRLFLLSKQATCKAVTVHDHYRNLKRLFNWLVEEKIMPESPMATIKPPRVPKTLITPFTLEQVKAILGQCSDRTFCGVRNRAIILTLLDTGLRLSELTNIKLTDVDFDREIIKVMGKGAKERIVRIGKGTQKAILRYLLSRKDSYPDLWVTEERTPLHTWGVEIMVRRMGKYAGLTVSCYPHKFRHTFATQSLRNGAGQFSVQALLGHSTLDMTKRYVSSLNSEDAVIAHRAFSPVDNFKLS
jgi:integrase/recombinase XerC/integrase/recombinase XerD